MSQKETQDLGFTPVCLYCGDRNVVRAGKSNGWQTFRCKVCGRYSRGVPGAKVRKPRERPAVPADAPNPFPCPMCKGRCVKAGFDRKRRQQFLCKDCGKRNVELWPQRKKSPGGPFPFLMWLYLDFRAERALNAYLWATQLSPAQAIRQIFREADAEPRRAMAAGRVLSDGRVRLWHPPGLESEVTGAEPLPDVRGLMLRRHWAMVREADGYGTMTQRKRLQSVCVTWRIGIALDQSARAGLIKTARKLGVTHQEAARCLIRRARGERS